MYEHIQLIRQLPLARLVFNRPDKRNSMVPEMGHEVAAAVKELNADPEVRAVIVTGAGDVFSAGGDLDMILELTRVDPAESRRFMASYYRRYFSLRQLHAPSIAMLNGHAIGAGLCVALACDLRTCSEHAKLGLTFVRVGLNVGMGGTYLLPRLIGLGRAAELLLTGRLVPASEAYDMGLVNRVCSPDTLEQQTVALAQSLAAHAPQALRYTKRSLYDSLGRDLDFAFDSEADGQAHCYQSRDILEGVEAVRAKREPRFTGD